MNLIKDTENLNNRKGHAFSMVVVILLLAAVFWYGFSRLGYRFAWETIYNYRINFLKGYGTTLLLSLFALILSLFLGTLFGLGQSSRILPLRYLSRFYVELIRGTPLLVQILIFFYVIANAAGLNNRFVVGVLIMALFSGAYIAEIIRGGVESIAASQLESARSLGFTPAQTYIYVIFPQVITRILPSLAGQLASLIKDSSLLSVIAIKEFTMAAREMNANTFSTMEAYIPLAIGYLLLTLPISRLTRYLEKRFSYET
ncbi:amino acid ABC transporter permease [Spirochaeta isovalerica]|uniref:Polar amino acid transport system permease protein n=1 Tax=Spirochaeta isovalerica TaxID=150 RepID=A0A841RAH2_9SPIO|nr:amino acid ABC transporter permease [Spirochaeta isovalerica]MBB6479678.1 polar amino acid transport system permease protein [Spirochaeta isovalerica]